MKFQDDDTDEDGFSDIAEDFGVDLNRKANLIELTAKNGADMGTSDVEDTGEQEDENDGFSDDDDDINIVEKDDKKEIDQGGESAETTSKANPVHVEKQSQKDSNSNNVDEDFDGLELGDVQDLQNRMALVRSSRENNDDSNYLSDGPDNPFANEELLFDEDDYVQDAERDAMEKRLEKVWFYLIESKI